MAAVLAEGRLGPRDPRAVDPTSWWGILPPAAPTGTTRGALAGISALAVIALCVCWITLVRRALSGHAGPRAALTAAVVWCLPFALGPPLFSRDAYAYAAQGELARRGLDPATHGVAALAADHAGALFSDAVDPRWRETHTPYGGGAVAVERFAAAAGHLLGGGPATALVTLRVVAVLAVVVLVACTVGLVDRLPTAGPAAVEAGGGVPAAGLGRAAVLALVAANPVTVIHLVGGMHLDALAAALLAAALLVDRRRAAHQVVSVAAVAATVLACFAGTIKVTTLLGFGWLLVAHARDAARSGLPMDARGAAAPERNAALPAGGPRWGRAAVAVAADLAAAAAVLGLSVLASGFPPTWIGALATSGELTTAIAPASLLAALVAAGAGLAGFDVAAGRGSSLLSATRAVTLVAAAVVVGVLLWRTWRRPATVAADGLDGLAVLAVGGLAAALGSPVLYPWYLGPALPMLAVLIAWARLAHLRAAPAPAGRLGAYDAEAPDRGWLARRRFRIGVGLVSVTSVWLCGATMSPLALTWRLFGRNGPAFPVPLVATLAVAAALVGLAAVSAARWRSPRRAAP